MSLKKTGKIVVILIDNIMSYGSQFPKLPMYNMQNEA